MMFRILVLAMGLSILAMLVIPATPVLAQTITLSPPSGFIGAEITITGTGFWQWGGHNICSIYFGDYWIKNIEASNDGTFTTTFNVPDVEPGRSYLVTVTDEKNGRSAVEYFTVLNIEVELDPLKGFVGSEVRIEGEGFPSLTTISVKYDGEDVDIISDVQETDSEGKLSCIIIVPESIAGNHIIAITDEFGNSIETEFSVEPQINIDPTSQVAGSRVKIHGTGFGEKEYITITLNGSVISTNPWLRTDRKGSFEYSFLAPSYAVGVNNRIGASGDMQSYPPAYHYAEAQLTILAAPTTPTETTTPIKPTTPASIHPTPTTSLASPGYVGIELVINGTGFTENSPVTITFTNHESVTVATGITDGNGKFSVTFISPPCHGGSHTIVATDGIKTAASIFIMESEAPLAPTLVLPIIGSTAEARVHFDWEDVKDPSGVTYTLQVASDANFTSIILERKELEDSEYIISEEEKLTSVGKEALYYWRVKSVDGASSESDWTYAFFYVGFSRASIPEWLKYMFYGLGGLVLGMLGFWIWKRYAVR